jgi:hypothetical protein
MDKSNSTRNEDKRSRDGDFEYYLKSGFPSHQVVATLRSQGKDQKEVDAFIEKYDASRKKIAKVIKKFVFKIEAKYGQLDIPELIKKGINFASKYNFTQAEKDAFINLVMRNDVDTAYVPYEDVNYTEMSKFLGVSNVTAHTFNVSAVDQPSLNEIARLYELTKPLHSAIRNNIITYRDFPYEMFTSHFSRGKHNPYVFIHPLIVALFLPRIEYLERRIMYSNIGRLTVQRTQQYFQSQSDRKFRNLNITLNDVLPGELEADLELISDIAKDPNSLNYISDETPMKNLLSRYSVQIELWKNILLLRNGEFYSKSTSFDKIDNDISRLTNILSAYEWTYFDSPDMSHVQDEGTMLRKILAVFSIRPTLTQISSYLNQAGIGQTNLGSVSRSTFIYTPVCNIKLPVSVIGSSSVKSVNLEQALSQSDWFIENKMLIPKSKAVIYSKQVLFFYVNRRYQSPITTSTVTFNYVAIPTSMSNLTSINTVELDYKSRMRLGNDEFNLRSVVCVNPLYNGKLSTGCSTLIVLPVDITSGRTAEMYAYYNPIHTSMKVSKVNGTNELRELNTITFMHRSHSVNNSTPSFNEMTRSYGTIFVYVKKETTLQVVRM